MNASKLGEAMDRLKAVHDAAKAEAERIKGVRDERARLGLSPAPRTGSQSEPPGAVIPPGGSPRGG